MTSHFNLEKDLDSILVLKKISKSEFDTKVQKLVIKNFKKWYGVDAEKTISIVKAWRIKDESA